MEAISLTEARRFLTAFVAKTSDPDSDPVIISVRGKPRAALISDEMLEELQKAKYREQCHKIFDELDALNKALVNK